MLSGAAEPRSRLLSRLLRTPPLQTMGVLYWQLQDVWAGPSWSSINADGR